MAKKQGQIYIRKFQDKSFYIGQTGDSSVKNQYNRAAAHAAGACGVDIYKGTNETGGARWKKGAFSTSFYPEDAKIREVGLSKTTYYTYDNMDIFQSLVAAFHEAGFYSTRKNQTSAATAAADTLDIAEISLIYYYLAIKKCKLLNQDQGGKAGLRYRPERSKWGIKLRSDLNAEGINYTSSGGVNLGKIGKPKSDSPLITRENDNLYNLLNNDTRPAEIEAQIKDYIESVVYEYVQQKVADAYAVLYSSNRGIETGIDTNSLTNELNDQLRNLNIAKIINNSGDNLKFTGTEISRQISELQTREPQNLVQAIVKKYYNGKHVWKTGDTFKKDLIKFLHEKGHKAQITYKFQIKLNGGSFKWNPQSIINQIKYVVEKNETQTNPELIQQRMVYGVCFAICYCIHTHIIDVQGPVLTVDGEEIAVRHLTQSEGGARYSDLLRAKVSGLLPRWLVKNDVAWNGYYDAAMALYHSMTNSHQMRMSKRDNDKFTHRYYFSNLNLNGGFNTDDFVGLSSFKHKQIGKIGKASEYGGNYYYKVSSGSIFEKIDDKNKMGVDYIWQRWKYLYNLS